MPLSAVKVLELNKKYNLIEGLCERELKNPEGCGFDLRVGEVYVFEEGDGFLGVTERTTPELKKIADVKKDGNKKIILKPGSYILVKTIEKITSPSKKIKYSRFLPKSYLMPHVYPRSTLQNCGIGLFCTKTDPGYSGQLRFGLANLGKNNFIFELGARMFNIVFKPIYGDLKRTYEGQWQGGNRAFIKGIEKQN